MAFNSSPIPLSYEDHYRLCSILSSPTTKIVTAAAARLYEAKFDAPGNAWAYSGIKGIAVFGYDSAAHSSRRHASSYWFRVVDIRRGKVLWEHDLREIINYEAEKPFFHIFSGKLCNFGFRFNEDEDAAVFYQEVVQRLINIPAPKTSSASSSASSSSKRSNPVSQPIPSTSHRRAVDRSKISVPVAESFEHVAHMGADESSNWNVAPEWTKLLEKLENYGVDAELVEENIEFVKGFLAGAEAMRSSPASSPKMKTHPSPSSSRTASVESLDYAYEQHNGYYNRDKRTRNISRNPAPFYQY